MQKLGEREEAHPYAHERRGFAGDCVHAAQSHFVRCLRDGTPCETEGAEYLRTLAVQEALYASAGRRAPVEVAEFAGGRG